MLLAGLITTTTRKLDREQQSEHFLEVQNNRANVVIFHIPPHPTINREQPWHILVGSVNRDEWL